MKTSSQQDVLKAIPLGGHGEIGKNSWLFEYKNEIIIVDFGMMLPSQGVTGVDLVFPSTIYLKQNEEKIKGLILTSAHDDSSGGVSYLLQKVKIPKIWGSKLALETISKDTINGVSREELTPRKEIQIGENFIIKPYHNTFVLPDSYGLIIQTGTGNILYTGLFKIDQTPPDGMLLDYFSCAQAGEDGVDLLISDSRDIENKGYSHSEQKVSKRFDEIFKETKSRIIIVGYASNLHKYQIIFNLAQKNNKKVFICSEYLNNKIQAAVRTGFFKIDKNTLVLEKDLQEVDDKDLVILACGKYGDFISCLIEISKQEHKIIKLKPKDTIVISANPPPGTVRLLAHTIDQLFIEKVQVTSGKGTHVLGHAAQEEVKFMLTVTKPRAFAPSHGEERHLVIHETLAENIGINPNDIHILKNGEILELRDTVVKRAGKIQAESIYYNQAQGLDIDETTMLERQTLSIEGTITVGLTVDSERNIIAGPEIFAEACAFAKGKDWRAFCLGTIELIKDAVKQFNERGEKDILNLKSLIRDTVNKNVLELIGKRPLINIAIQEIAEVKR